MSDMDDLIAWLRVQLDEDERVAAGMEREMQRVKTAPIFQARPLGWLTGVDIFVSPKRWLAEVEAKRRVLELTDFSAQFPDMDGGYDSACEDVIKLLALPYADRPGYLPEWGIGSAPA